MFPWRYRLVKGAMFKLSAKRADLLLTVSDYSRRQIAKHYGISAEEIVVTRMRYRLTSSKLMLMRRQNLCKIKALANTCFM